MEKNEKIYHVILIQKKFNFTADEEELKLNVYLILEFT